MDKTNSQQARAIAVVKRRAEKTGDKDSAQFLLQEFVNHADVFERADVPLADRLVLRFVARGIREILAGVQPRRALCMDSSGRPKSPSSRNLNLALMLYRLYDNKELKERARANGAKPLDYLARTVAREYNKSRDKRQQVTHRVVLEAWKDHGSRKGVSEIMAICLS